MTLVELLQARKSSQENHVFFVDNSQEADALSFSKLYELAGYRLGALQDLGLRQHDELIFQLEDNREFLITFWACLLGGIIPVPLTLGKNFEHRLKLQQVIKQLHNAHIITTDSGVKSISDFLSEQLPTFKIDTHLLSVDQLGNSESAGVIPAITADDIAFIQFSSGTTGIPKGVVLSHENLLRNLEGISTSANYTSKDVMFSWMPLTHDMGMIGFHLNPMYSGCDHYIMSTNLFIRNPNLWMDKASEAKATVLCSPNFGYRYLLKFMKDDSRGWDLSNIRIIYNGAEPISKSLCDEFNLALKKYQLKDTALCPVYGLAEASVAVSMSKLDATPQALQLDRNQLNIGNEIAQIGDSPDAIGLVNVGQAVKNTSIRIVNDAGKENPEGIIGHIQIQGTNVTAGYYNNPEATEGLYDAEGWLYTGDIGFVYQSDLYISGRAKDIIFVNGQNYYPYDLEQEAEALDGIELNKVVFTGHFNHDRQAEEIIAFVLQRGAIAKFIPVQESLKALINLKFGIEVHRVVPVKDIPRTTSGKLQRFKLLQQYLKGEFDEKIGQLDEAIAAAAETKVIQQPGTELEAQLLAIWQEILGRSDFGVADKFYELGGNSLSAVAIAGRVMQEFEVEIHVEGLNGDQTISGLADIIQNSQKTTYTRIPVSDSNDRIPVSGLQKRLFYAWKLHPQDTAYNVPVCFELKGDIALERIRKALQQMVDQHDALRMVYGQHEELTARILDPFAIELQAIKTDAEALASTLQSLVQPFVLDQGPLFRFARILESDNDKQYLFMDFHHGIIDGVSLDYFIHELMNQLAGQDIQIPASANFKDYLLWQNDKQDEQAADHRAFWKDQLEGTLPVLELPYDFARTPIVKREGKKHIQELPAVDFLKLRTFGEAEKHTLHVVLLSAYFVWLAKHANEQELIVGLPVSGRVHPDIQRSIGVFVNNLPMRMNLTHELSFRQLLAEVKDLLKVLLEHQAYPFDAMVQDVGAVTSDGRNPIFDTMFIYQNMKLHEQTTKEFAVNWYPFDPGTSQFDLSLEVVETSQYLQFGFEYSTHLFQAASIERMAGNYMALVKTLIAQPDVPLKGMQIDAAAVALQTKWNQTQVKYDREATLNQLFQARVSANPDRIAVAQGDQRVTYHELNALANGVANHLIAKGLTDNQAVAISASRSIHFLAGVLGILKAGGCFVPIDPDSPADRTLFIIEDSACFTTLFETEGAYEAFHRETGKAVNYEVLNTIQPSENAPEVEMNAESLAYSIYTSGTTGRPKGALLSHRSIVNYVTWAGKTYTKEETPVFALFTSVAFDLTLTSIFTPLTMGGKIIAYPEATDRSLIQSVIRDNQSTIIKLTPSHLRLIIQPDFHVPESSVLKTIIVGGEELSSQLTRATIARFGGELNVYNEYGPTEATVGCMIHLFDANQDVNAVPIGIPAPNVQLYVLDEHQVTVPIGVLGELYVAGDQLAAGYRNNPTRTEESFIPNPFQPGSLMYRTGDLVKRLPDGKLLYSGRRDSQTKISGYRVELSEISSALEHHAEINTAVVDYRSSDADQKTLHAYFVSTGTEKLQAHQLKSFLAKALPHYMIPAYFHQVDEIPLTANGKVDYKVLASTQALKEQVKVPARNEFEAIMVEVWQSILKKEPVHITDNFYELGGDSIKAVQVSSTLFEQGIECNAQDILIYQTIEEICRVAQPSSIDQYDQAPAKGEVPHKPIDRWFFGQKLAQPHHYNQSVLLDLKIKLDVSTLNQAFDQLIKHHDVLRLNVNETGQLYYNAQHLEGFFTCESYQVEDTKAIESIGESLKSNFDLSQSLLIKAALISRENDSDLLLITAHHLIVDGVSWRILLKDLYGLLDATLQEEDFTLPRKTASLQDWDQALKTYEESAEYQASQQYWEAIDETTFTIPTDHQSGEWKQSNRKLISVADAQVVPQMRAQGSFNDTVMQSLLVTALYGAMEKWTNQSTVTVEMESHGRSLATVNTSQTVGWFTAMYPLHLKVDTADPAARIQEIDQALSTASTHSLAYGIAMQDKPTKPPVTQVRFNYLGEFQEELNNDLFQLTELSHGGEIGPDNQVSSILEFNILLINEEIRIELNYLDSVHQEATVRQLLEDFLTQLTAYSAHAASVADSAGSTDDDEDEELLTSEDMDLLFQ